jgi:hypothetical protein
MRKVTRQTRAEKKTSSKGKTYILFTYELDDGQLVTSLQKFKAGDRVETWFDDAWGIPKMRLYEPKKTV